MKHSIRNICLGVVGLCSSACVTNNLPFPLIDPEVSIEVEDARTVSIDHSNHVITLDLEEHADICHVKVTRFEIACPDGITVSKSDRNPVQVDGIDLSKGQTFNFNISNYEGSQYKWAIRATQEIERYFTVEGQIGSTVIDPENCRVKLYVTQKTKLSNVTVKSMKLGPADKDGHDMAIYSKSIDEKWNMLDDYTEVDVICHGRTETWFVYAEKSLVNVSWEDYCGWSRCAWVCANGVEGGDNGFRYRKSGDEEWINVPAESIVSDGGRFTACIDGLEELTTYQCYAYSGDDMTEIGEFTTEQSVQIPNGSLDVYSHAESSLYYSFFDPAHTLWSQKWWDSGNVGSTAVGASGIICAPDTETIAPGIEGNTASAKLTSKYVVVKFAAGNIFTGEFAGLVGTSGGIVNFGRPWTARPRKLILSVKTNCGLVNHKDGNIKDINIGDPDIAELFVALGDWDYKKYGGTTESPVQVNTTKENTLFNPDGENVIAYGRYATTQTQDWTEIEVPLGYRDCFRKPTHIIISCASSKYGDFFTGCDTNVLWVDNMRFEY